MSKGSKTVSKTEINAALVQADMFKPSGICRRREKRPAEAWWVGESGVLAWTHGMGSPWCHRCCLEE
jgi:hypothetical protein